MKVLYKKGWFQLILAWYDFWIGLYYDVGHRTLYFLPFPMVVLRFQLPGRQDESKHRKDRESQCQLGHKWIPLENSMLCERCGLEEPVFRIGR